MQPAWLQYQLRQRNVTVLAVTRDQCGDDMLVVAHDPRHQSVLVRTAPPIAADPPRMKPNTDSP